VPYATAFGGVEFGNMNDKEQANVPGIRSNKLGKFDASARAARIGINIVEAVGSRNKYNSSVHLRKQDLTMRLRL